MRRIKLILLMVVACFCAATATPRISLLTALPGAEVYQLEGHTALRIQDSDSGADYVVNWGVFDFNSPNFVWRFVLGETDYLCYAYPSYYFFEEYRIEGRSVIEQTLALDSLQAITLVDLVRNNLKPENAVYRYNYVKDNCATRPLNLLETVIGHPAVSDNQSGRSTFRKEMSRYHAAYPWYQFGIDLALGSGIDNEISNRERCFAPIYLMDNIDRSLIREETTIGQQTLKTAGTPWFMSPLAISLFILLASMAICFRKRAQWFDSLLFGAFALMGIVVTFLVFISTHEATSPNALVLWMNPFCLLGAILPWIKSARKAGICYFFVNFALLILMILLIIICGRGMNAAFWPLIAADMVRSIDNIRRCKKKVKR